MLLNSPFLGEEKSCCFFPSGQRFLAWPSFCFNNGRAVGSLLRRPDALLGGDLATLGAGFDGRYGELNSSDLVLISLDRLIAPVKFFLSCASYPRVLVPHMPVAAEAIQRPLPLYLLLYKRLSGRRSEMCFPTVSYLELLFAAPCLSQRSMESCQLVASSSRMEAEEEAFFDTREELLASPARSPAPALPWSGRLDSVQERKERFLRSMGLECSPSPRQADPVCTAGDVEKEEERGIVPEIGRLSSQSEENDCSMSSWSTEETTSCEDGVSDDNSVSGSSKDDGCKVGRSFSSLSFIRRLMSRNGKRSAAPTTVERRRNGWFERLGVAACVVDYGDDEASTSTSDSEQIRGGRYERIKVRSYRKRSKELSALYQGQVIKAHDGAILTMKFSPDGQFLATGGEDGVIRIWGVSQSDDCKIPLDDPSCIYLKARRKYGLAPVNIDNEKRSKVKGMKKTGESACIVIPTMVFQISEEPLHEFHGHAGDVLDLSWSNNKVS